jgi:hypothetical protein
LLTQLACLHTYHLLTLACLSLAYSYLYHLLHNTLDGHTGSHNSHDNPQNGRCHGDIDSELFFSTSLLFDNRPVHESGIYIGQGIAQGGSSKGQYKTDISERNGHDGNEGQEEHGRRVEFPSSPVGHGDIQQVQDAVAASGKGEWVGEDERDGDGDAAAAHEDIGGGVIVEDEAITGSSKGQESYHGDESHEEDRYSKAGRNDRVETRERVILELQVEFGGIEMCLSHVKR